MHPRGAPRPHAFSKKNRLLTAGEFDRVFKQGRRLSLPEVTLAFRQRPSREGSLQLPRLGLSVSRKVGNAVERNRVKRRLREIFRTQKDSFLNGSEFVFVPRKNMSILKFNDFKLTVLELFKRSKLTNNEK